MSDKISHYFGCGELVMQNSAHPSLFSQAWCLKTTFVCMILCDLQIPVRLLGVDIKLPLQVEKQSREEQNDWPQPIQLSK